MTSVYPGLAAQRKKLADLGVSGMSSDETSDGDGVRRYRILSSPWRSDAVTAWLRFFDASYIRARADGALGSRRGALPRERRTARRQSNSKRFVKGLPKNAYRQEWLNEQIDVANMVRPGPSVSWTHEPSIVE
jgi:hypothetical protein